MQCESDSVRFETYPIQLLAGLWLCSGAEGRRHSEPGNANNLFWNEVLQFWRQISLISRDWEVMDEFRRVVKEGCRPRVLEKEARSDSLRFCSRAKITDSGSGVEFDLACVKEQIRTRFDFAWSVCRCGVIGGAMFVLADVCRYSFRPQNSKKGGKANSIRHAYFRNSMPFTLAAASTFVDKVLPDCTIMRFFIGGEIGTFDVRLIHCHIKCSS